MSENKKPTGLSYGWYLMVLGLFFIVKPTMRIKGWEYDFSANHLNIYLGVALIAMGGWMVRPRKG